MNGNFIEIRVNNDIEPFLRRPISIYNVDKENFYYNNDSKKENHERLLPETCRNLQETKPLFPEGYPLSKRFVKFRQKDFSAAHFSDIISMSPHARDRMGGNHDGFCKHLEQRILSDLPGWPPGAHCDARHGENGRKSQ